ncbi:hypothetical protein MMC24_007686 [Lignoscripta atroalba]|nr:hypothetical protein [Lignoscripta atroalba]
MDQDFIGSSPEYCTDLSQYAGYPDLIGRYAYDGTSTDSSPSPIMMFTNLDPLHYDGFSGMPEGIHNFDQQSPSPSVEFTDLTAPYNEDRRRRRSNAIKDKQTISSMHMRRRAQNRASQRAFRERKEKHTQELQQQLDDLEAKHENLTSSFADLGATNAKLRTELEQLRSRIKSLQSAKDEAFEEMMATSLFEHISSGGGGVEAEQDSTS